MRNMKHGDKNVIIFQVQLHAPIFDNVLSCTQQDPIVAEWTDKLRI